MKNSFFLTLLIIPLFVGCGRGDIPRVRTVPLMGTFVNITVCGIPSDKNKVIDDAILLAGTLESKFNAFDPESEVNKVNMEGGGEISSDLYEVLEISNNISSLTEGEFDITVAPILKKEGFYKEMPAILLNNIPNKYIKESWDKVDLVQYDRVILKDGVWIDLSGIAKGYIVDRMASFLSSNGLNIFLINAGGDMFCGKSPGGKKWRVGLREPGSEDVVLVLAVEDAAVATSGDYENWVFSETVGLDVTHIVDPENISVIKKKLSSVTVIASTCVYADALATGMMAMGSSRAIDLAETAEGVEVITVDRDGEGYRIGYSSGAEKYISKS